jgi:Flp pilus assembly pilin Flp
MFVRRGQTILEYTIIIGIVAIVFVYMGAGMKRGLQSMIKVTADQIGNQENSDQDFNDVEQGYMVSSTTSATDSLNVVTNEIGYIPKSGPAVYVTDKVENESTFMVSNALTNAGFNPSS